MGTFIRYNKEKEGTGVREMKSMRYGEELDIKYMAQNGKAKTNQDSKWEKSLSGHTASYCNLDGLIDNELALVPIVLKKAW